MLTPLNPLDTPKDLAEARRTPGALIVNEHFPAADGTRRAATLHAAACRSLGGASPEHKLSAPDLESAIAWLRENKGKEGPDWYRCPLCRPRSTVEKRGSGQPVQPQFVLNDSWAAGNHVLSSLHRAECPALSRASSAHIQTFENIQVATTWLRTNRGSEGWGWVTCGICRPATSGAAKSDPQAASGAGEIGGLATAPAPLNAGAPSGDGTARSQVPKQDATPSPMLQARDEELPAGETRVSPLAKDVERLEAREADLTAQLGGVQDAWESLVVEADELRVRADHHSNEALEWAALQADLESRVKYLEARLPEKGTANSAQLTAAVCEEIAGELAAERNIDDASRLAIIEMLRDVADTDPMKEHRGVLLSRLRRDKEAIEGLRSVARLTSPLGLRSLALSSLRIGKLPGDPEALDAVDWAQPSNFTVLRDALPTLNREDALVALERMIEKLSRPELGELFALELEYARENAAQRQVFDLWASFDPGGSASHIVAMADERTADEPHWWAAQLESILARDPSNEAALAALEATMRFLPISGALAMSFAVADHLSGSTELTFRLRSGVAIFERGPAKDLLEQVADLVLMLPSRFREFHSEAEAEEAVALLRRIRPFVGPAIAEKIQSVAVGVDGIDSSVTPDDEYPKDVATALRRAAARYPGIKCLDQAVTQARSWPEKDRADMWELLRDLGDLTERWRKGEAGHLPDELRRLGHGFAAGSSKASQNRFKDDYVRTDADGTSIVLGPHFKFGGRRLMFAIRDDDRRIVIGYAGNHPRTVSSKG